MHTEEENEKVGVAYKQLHARQPALLQVLGVSDGTKEDGASWTAFLRGFSCVPHCVLRLIAFTSPPLPSYRVTAVLRIIQSSSTQMRERKRTSTV